MHEKVCLYCGKRFVTKYPAAKYCSRGCVFAACRGRKERPMTRDTPFLCQLYRRRGESVRQIARDLDRTADTVRQALSEPLDPYHRQLLESDTYRRTRR